MSYNPKQPRVPAGNSDGGQWTEMSSGDFQAQLKSALEKQGVHVHQPPNQNSLSKYLTVGKKSKLHSGVDAVGSVRVRIADHEGYGADFDFRPNAGNKYRHDVNNVATRIVNDHLKKMRD